GAAADATDLDDWLGALGRAGVPVATSTGTSGQLALVPRDQATYRAMRMINLAVLGPLLLGRLGGDAGLGSPVERLTPRAAAGPAGGRPRPGLPVRTPPPAGRRRRAARAPVRHPGQPDAPAPGRRVPARLRVRAGRQPVAGPGARCRVRREPPAVPGAAARRGA